MTGLTKYGADAVALYHVLQELAMQFSKKRTRPRFGSDHVLKGVTKPGKIAAERQADCSTNGDGWQCSRLSACLLL